MTLRLGALGLLCGEFLGTDEGTCPPSGGEGTGYSITVTPLIVLSILSGSIVTPPPGKLVPGGDEM